MPFTPATTNSFGLESPSWFSALDELSDSLAEFGDYVAQQVLAVEIKVVAEPAGEFATTTDLDEKPLRIALSRR